MKLGTTSVNKARSKNTDQLFLKTKKTDHSDFLKDYQNSRKVREKPVDLRNEQLVISVFESQNRLDPKKQQFLKTFQKFMEKKGTMAGTATRRMPVAPQNFLLHYLRKQLLEASINRQQTRKKLTGLRS